MSSRHTCHLQYIQVQIMCKAAGADRLHKQQHIQKHVLITDLIDGALSIAGAAYPQSLFLICFFLCSRIRVILFKPCSNGVSLVQAHSPSNKEKGLAQ